MNRFRSRHTGKARHIAGSMNKLEASYSALLRLKELSGEIMGFAFEAVKLRLADNTFYTPDFVVYASDGTVEFHETKGFWEEDARVKIKVAAAQFPFRFYGIQFKKKEWITEEFTNT